MLLRQSAPVEGPFGRLAARFRGAIDVEHPPLPAITVTVMLGVIMSIIDATIVNVALPTMAGNLGASTDEIAWVVTSYILASVVIMPLNGWLTAVFGRQKYYATSLAVFTVASVACGTATNVWMLVVYRIFQGLGGGALQPTAQAILFESYPPERRGSAMAVFGMGAMVAPAIGPVLGGIIVDQWSWPLIFFINIPIGVIALLMTYAFIRDPKYIGRHTGSVDWSGLILMTVGISAMQYVLERGQHDDWFSSDAIAVLTVVSVGSLVGFLVWELRARFPVVNLRIFRSRAFSAGNAIGVISGFGLFGLNLILPLFFQTVLGFDATQAGLALLPGAIATAISMPVAGRLVNKVEARYLVIAGLAIFGVSAWWMGGFNQNSGFWDIFWPRAIQGFALGILFVPLSTATLAGVSRAEMAGASGVYTLIRQLGGSLGIAILTTLLVRQSAVAQSALASGVTLAAPAVRQMLADPSTHAQAIQMLNGVVELNSTVIAYDFLFRLSAIVFFLTIPMVLLMRSGKAAAAGRGGPIPAAE